MDASSLRETLESAGEVMINVEEFEEPIAMHLHDTDIGDDVITIELADGTLTVGTDRVTGFWIHEHALDHYGLE